MSDATEENADTRDLSQWQLDEIRRTMPEAIERLEEIQAEREFRGEQLERIRDAAVTASKSKCKGDWLRALWAIRDMTEQPIEEEDDTDE